MAKPIKDTPTLKGKDAERFNKRLEVDRGVIADPKEKERIRQNFQKLQSIAKF